MKKIFFLFFNCLFVVTMYSQEIIVDKKYKGTARKLDRKQVLTTIAFGSCNNQSKSQEMWKEVVKNKPQLWVWLGDNIYADTKDPKVMADKYSTLKNNIDYRKLLACAAVVGTWDDHDYGKNDAGKEFTMKKMSKRLMLDFLDVPKDAKVRKREGAYQSFTFGEKGKKVKIILLDARYFRDPVERTKEKYKEYIANPDGDILGEKQWEWLEKQLKNSDAQIHLIASGIQMIPTEHRFEKWANFPKARKKLFHVLQKTKPSMPILMSGDRHIAELSKIEIDGLDLPLFEITASGLTHTWGEMREEPNQFRVGQLIAKKNFGLMKIDWSGKTPKVFVEVRGNRNEVFLQENLH